jgi:hypothetical protein
MAARRPVPKPAKGKAAPAKEKKVKEPKEIKPGPPVESVLAVVTGVLLLTAFFLVDYTKGRDYGTGLLFKSKYEASK